MVEDDDLDVGKKPFPELLTLAEQLPTYSRVC
jgi:hypothetical protein